MHFPCPCLWSPIVFLSFIRFNLFVKSLFFDPLSRGFDKQSAKMGFNKYHPESSEFGNMVEPLNMFLGYLSFVPLTSPFTSIIAPTRCLHWTPCPSAPPPSMSPLLRPMWGWPTSLRCRSTRRRAELGGGWIVKYWALRKMDMECNNTIDVGTCWNMQSKYGQESHRKSVKQLLYHDHEAEQIWLWNLPLWFSDSSKVCRYGDSDQWQQRYLPGSSACGWLQPRSDASYSINQLVTFSENGWESFLAKFPPVSNSYSIRFHHFRSFSKVQRPKGPSKVQ